MELRPYLVAPAVLISHVDVLVSMIDVLVSMINNPSYKSQNRLKVLKLGYAEILPFWQKATKRQAKHWLIWQVW